jgi:hypothetical protein
MLQQLASKVVEYNAYPEDWAAAATQLGQLTRLEFMVHGAFWGGGGDPCVLAAVSGLQELRLSGNWAGSSLAVELVQQAAGMAQLRRLRLDGHGAAGAELSACLAQCTQLTSLVLLLRGDQRYADCPWSTAVCHLTGLRHSMVPAEVLQQEAGAWLVPLGALTCLCVELQSWESLHPREEHMAFYADEQQQRQWMEAQYRTAQQLLQQVQVWPASLQQVVFGFSGAGDVQVMPSRWQHTPSRSGASSQQIAVWLEEDYMCGQLVQHWARPFNPCPHLPGVWELQGQEEDRL